MLYQLSHPEHLIVASALRLASAHLWGRPGGTRYTLGPAAWVRSKLFVRSAGRAGAVEAQSQGPLFIRRPSLQAGAFTRACAPASWCIEEAVQAPTGCRASHSQRCQPSSLRQLILPPRQHLRLRDHLTVFRLCHCIAHSSCCLSAAHLSPSLLPSSSPLTALLRRTPSAPCSVNVECPALVSFLPFVLVALENCSARHD